MAERDSVSKEKEKRDREKELFEGCQKVHRGVCRQQSPDTIAVKQHQWPGTVAHACNPSTLRDQGGRITEAQEFKTSLGNIVRPQLYFKKKKKELARCGCRYW